LAVEARLADVEAAELEKLTIAPVAMVAKTPEELLVVGFAAVVTIVNWGIYGIFKRPRDVGGPVFPPAEGSGVPQVVISSAV
jgi:hypothetical protein